MTKPFVLLSTRPDDAPAAAEYEAFARHSGLGHELEHIRVERSPLQLDLNDYSGIFIGGSPFNTSDPQVGKSPVQQRVEAELNSLLDIVVAEDFPFFGACYGVGTLGVHEGGVVDTTFEEPAGVIEVTLTPAGRADPLLEGVPDQFWANVGHHEAVTLLPPAAALLGIGTRCPVQIFRIKQNLYATQFHPELDHPAMVERMAAYLGHGYVAPEEFDAVVASLDGVDVAFSHRLLSNFARKYARA